MLLPLVTDFSRDLPGVVGASPWLPSDEFFLSHEGEEKQPLLLPLTLLGLLWGCRGDWSMLRSALCLKTLFGVLLPLIPPWRWCGEAAVAILPRFGASNSTWFWQHKTRKVQIFNDSEYSYLWLYLEDPRHHISNLRKSTKIIRMSLASITKLI